MSDNGAVSSAKSIRKVPISIPKVTTTDDLKSITKPKVNQHCSNCRGHGHNAATCPERTIIYITGTIDYMLYLFILIIFKFYCKTNR